VEAGEIVVAYYTAQAVYNTNSQEFGTVLKSMARSGVEATDITVLFEALKTDTFYGFGFFVREVATAQLDAGNISALLKTAKTATDAGYGRWFFGLAGFAWGDIARSQVAPAEIVASFRTAKEMSRGWTGDLDHALREVVAAQVKLGDIAAALTTVEGIDSAGDRAVSYTQIAKTQANSGDWEVARQTFGTAFEAAQGMENGVYRVKALRNLLEAHVEVGDVAGARKVAEDIKPLHSDVFSVWASARIATAQANSGDRKAAGKTFAAALKTAQGMKEMSERDAALMVVVQSQLEVGDVPGARKASTSLRSNFPRVRALTSVALAQVKLGYKQAARQDFAAALETAQGVKDMSERDAALMVIIHRLPKLVKEFCAKNPGSRLCAVEVP
jgi:tetratricopeptide (TPR) repeat protein